ncbi:uncharacterized protein PFL1_02998 [Pseudozyma flocculosa PF-1]|uniref:SH3 domain-containing protein n=2 Tax=Pseudozyma flocculosa TaxID=84751 RepID=A0A5C3F0E4_9BASI|nr:uncharacterized protein PFL1_02998 [Pseudozyma flocculosa PF-1]EPQ29243.1 hypothetical protein PFL1_02998 [Pseudozyma flocculosa PF-1]SPO37742.1 uncharacterized protein PSFLO_03218 [Pseudozyma flocculosa]
MPASSSKAARQSLPTTSTRSSMRQRIRQSSRLIVAASAMAALMCGPSIAAAADDFPSIDFGLLGAVGVSGSFAALEIWNQTGASSGPNVTYDANASTLLQRAGNGTLTKVSATERGGSIRAICQLPGSPDTVFVGGTFFSIGGTSVSNIASYNTQTKAFDALGGGLDGDVLTLYCDAERRQVLAGGSFSGPVNGKTDRYLGSVASWSQDSAAWSPIAFGGLNGTVNAIAAGANSSLVRFGGEFDTRFASIGANGLESGTRSSASSLTNALAPISLGQVEFVGGPSSGEQGYSNPAQVLCPQGGDGPNNSYLFEDGAVGRLTARAFRSLDVRAIRLGNTFIDGRGTRTFGVVSIPDNTELELLYLDPQTNQNVTCTNNCTLSQDPTLPYQDFLIRDVPANNAPGGVKTLTGVQFTASEHYGAGAGLHILELLSSGGWAYAYNALNRGACNSPEEGVNGTSSTTTTEGGWYPTAVTTLSGTSEPALALTDSYSNLQANTDATVTFSVDIPVNGNYTVNMFVPGCAKSGQCGERTDVNVNVFPVANSQGRLTRISQTNADDRTVEIYSGEIQKAADGFSPTVILSIPDDAPAPSGGSRFTVVADRIGFVLRDSNETLSMSRQTGFGVLEYNVFDDAVASIRNNGTGTLPNTTMTAIDTFSATLFSRGVRRTENEYVSAVVSAGGKTFVGGSFESNNGTSFANIAAFTDESQGKEAVDIANGGLNDEVLALAAVGGSVFAGGRFTRLADNSAAVSYVARYDPAADTWAPLGGGTNGAVLSLTPLPSNQLLVVGDFDSVNGSTQAGVAVWDTTSNAWQTQSMFLSGTMTAASSSASAASDSSYVAGSVKAISHHSASGAVELTAPERSGDPPTIDSLNFQFTVPTESSDAPNPSSSSSGARRRAVAARSQQVPQRLEARDSTGGGSLKSRLRSLLPRSEVKAASPFMQSQTSLMKRASALSPSSLASSGTNEVLASAFWQRDDGSYVNIIGGNFSTTEGVRNLAMYDDKAGELSAFPPLPASTMADGTPLTVIRSLLVDSDILYVGGDGGLETYDLKKGTWSERAAALNSRTSQELSVTSINHRPDTSTIIVAGNFDSAGSLPCMNICEWDSVALRWTPLGAGVGGEISTVDFAGGKANQLIVAGSVSVNNVEAALASYNFDTQMWSTLGSIGTGAGQAPGPATAASVDDLNPNSIFVAGRTSDDTAPYLAKWDGAQYTAVDGGELIGDSGVAQLTFVPINKAHAGNSVLENNRLLVVSGNLETQSYGRLSSLLFDGQGYIPFLRATNLNGSSGIVRSFSRSTEVLKFPNLHRLAVGLVILISIAIGLGIVFLLVLLGLIWALSRRRPNEQVDVPISGSEDSLAVGEKKRPSSLLATLNAATENAMVGGGPGAGASGGGGMVGRDGFPLAGAAVAGGAAAGAAAAAGRTSSSGHDKHDSAQMGTMENSDGTGPSQYHSEGAHTGYSARTQYLTDEGEYLDGAGEAAAGAGAIEMMDNQDDSPGSEGIPAHARYDFVPNHESELGVTAGEAIEILDDQDEHWWLARNAEGRTGVIPSTYVL